MAIDVSDMITPEKKLLIAKIADTLDQTIPAIEEMVSNGLPFDDHLQKYREKRQWIAKFQRLFKVPTTMASQSTQ